MAIEDGLLIGSQAEIEAWFAANGKNRRDSRADIFKEIVRKAIRHDRRAHRISVVLGLGRSPNQTHR